MVQASMRNVGTWAPIQPPSWWREGDLRVAETTRGRVPMRSTGADHLVVVMKPGNAGGAKGVDHPGVFGEQPLCSGMNR